MQEVKFKVKEPQTPLLDTEPTAIINVENHGEIDNSPPTHLEPFLPIIDGGLLISHDTEPPAIINVETADEIDNSPPTPLESFLPTIADGLLFSDAELNGKKKRVVPGENGSTVSKDNLRVLKSIHDPTKDPTVPFQLVPFSEVRGIRPGTYDVVERRLREGAHINIGRVSSKSPVLEHPGFLNIKSKVVSRSHARIYASGGKIFIKDMGSTTGTFINSERISLEKTMSEKVQIKEGDIICLGTEFKDKGDVINRRVSFKFAYYDQTWISACKSNIDKIRFRNAMKTLLHAANPKTNATLEDDDTVPECCICIAETTALQPIFFAPCSHVFHFKCVQNIIFQSPMFSCPLCRQMSNLTSSLSNDDLQDIISIDESDENAKIEELIDPALLEKIAALDSVKTKTTFSKKLSAFFQKVKPSSSNNSVQGSQSPVNSPAVAVQSQQLLLDVRAPSQGSSKKLLNTGLAASSPSLAKSSVRFVAALKAGEDAPENGTGSNNAQSESHLKVDKDKQGSSSSR